MKIIIIPIIFMLAFSSVAAPLPIVISKPFQVCAKPEPGIAHKLVEGIDAASGFAKSGRAVVRINIGGHPAPFRGPRASS